MVAVVEASESSVSGVATNESADGLEASELSSAVVEASESSAAGLVVVESSRWLLVFVGAVELSV